MAGIPSWGWLSVGLFVTVTSSSIGGSLSFFAWIGLLFIAVGISKLVYFIVLEPKETKQEQKMVPVFHQQASKACPRCRMAVSQHDNYCRVCGTRLRY